MGGRQGRANGTPRRPDRERNFLDTAVNSDSASWSAYKENAKRITDSYLSDSERQAFVDYAGALYSPMNSLLRSGTVAADDYDLTPRGLTNMVQKAQEATALLDAAFSRSEVKLAQSVILYRNLGPAHLLYRDLLTGAVPIGKVYSDKGFQSTSTRAPSKSAQELVTLRIKAKKGAKALHIEHLSPYGSREAETVLPRGAKYKVAGYKYTTNGSVLVDVLLL